MILIHNDGLDRVCMRLFLLKFKYSKSTKIFNLVLPFLSNVKTKWKYDAVHMLQMKRTQVLVCKIGLEWELESQSQVTLPICLLFKSTFTCASTHVWKRKKWDALQRYICYTILVFHNFYSRLLVPKVNLKQLKIASEIPYFNVYHLEQTDTT